MLGLEKRVDAVRQMCGVEPENPENRNPQGVASAPATTGVMLACVALVVAIVVYFALDARYSAKMDALAQAYSSRLAALEEKVDAPREMAKKMILANSLAEVAQKMEQIKALAGAEQQEKLAKIDEMLKALRQDLK